jgi:hypothetical protein
MSKEIAAIEEAMAKLKANQGKNMTQEQFGELQEKLGELQGRLGDIQGEIGSKQGEFGERMGALGEKMGAQLLEIRLTDIRGQVVTDTLKALPSQGDKGVYFVEGHVQFAK